VTPAKIFVALTLVGGCTYDTHFDDCVVRCADDQTCPEDLTCGADGLCRSPGAMEACVGGSNTHPSCTGLAATCGPNADEDCCSTAQPIPGGTFYRSYDVAGDGLYPDMGYPATVSPFRLDRFEVTVGRFRKFVESGGGTQANPPVAGAGARPLNGSENQGGWAQDWNTNLESTSSALVTAVNCQAPQATWTNTPGADEDLPINCISWYEAFAFCVWDEGFLPTEAEWNYVATGGDEQRAYAWSSPPSSISIDCSYTNYNSAYPSNAFCVNGMTGATNRVGSASPKGDGKWGHSDLGGNVDQWVLDIFATYNTPCNDCANLSGPGGRVLRSGDWANDAGTVRSGRRGATTPSGNRDPKIGLRCARLLSP
jgi:formylglycine-generating enzyme required for sulfatase activity